MATNVHDALHNVDVSMLQQRIDYSGTDPEYIGLAAKGAKLAEKRWQIKKFEATTAQPTEVNFAENANGIPDNGFIFSWDAALQVTELRISNALQPGNTITVDVDAVTESQLFSGSSDATLAALAVDIAGEAGVATAVVRESGGPETDRDRVIVITAAVAGTAFVLDAEDITGGIIQSTVEIRTTITNQGDHTTLTFSP